MRFDYGGIGGTTLLVPTSWMAKEVSISTWTREQGRLGPGRATKLTLRNSSSMQNSKIQRRILVPYC